MKTFITGLLLALFMGGIARAERSEVTGIGEASYRVWSIPEDTIYDKAKRNADRHAADQCEGEVERISNYETIEQASPPLIIVTVRARYRCL